MSQLIDLEDTASLEKLGHALLKIPSFVSSFTEKIIKTPETRELLFNSPEFKTAVDTAIVLSENKILPRLRSVEKVTGNYVFEDFEEHDPTLPEKIDILEEKIQNIDYRPTIRLDVEIKNPETKTEERAFLLVEELKSSGKEYFSSHEIIGFLKSKLPDTCKIDERVQNIHKVKSDVLKKAENMFNDVFMNKKKTGHREVRLILKNDITCSNLS
jgi:hypothetical protein